MGIPYLLTCLLRNLYAHQEATVRTGHGTTDWFQIRKIVRQGCILSPCLFNLYAEYIMRKAGLEEAQAGIKIAGRNINNLRYADDTTVMAESKELKSVLMKMKEESEKLASNSTFRKLRSLHLVLLLLLLLLSRFSRVWLCATPQMAAHQAPPSLGLSRQEHWSGLPFPSLISGPVTS